MLFCVVINKGNALTRDESADFQMNIIRSSHATRFSENESGFLKDNISQIFRPLIIF